MADHENPVAAKSAARNVPKARWQPSIRAMAPRASSAESTSCRTRILQQRQLTGPASPSLALCRRHTVSDMNEAKTCMTLPMSARENNAVFALATNRGPCTHHAANVWPQLPSSLATRHSAARPADALPQLPIAGDVALCITAEPTDYHSCRARWRHDTQYHVPAHVLQQLSSSLATCRSVTQRLALFFESYRPTIALCAAP